MIRFRIWWARFWGQTLHLRFKAKTDKQWEQDAIKSYREESRGET